MVGLLLITHEALGDALLHNAASTLGHCPLPTEVLAVGRDSDPEERRQRAAELACQLNDGDGVLVLTDMYGSTPSNIACSLANLATVRIIAGVNLPMLIRVFNYATLDLDTLSDKALSGGHDGVVSCSALTTAAAVTLGGNLNPTAGGSATQHH